MIRVSYGDRYIDLDVRSWDILNRIGHREKIELMGYEHMRYFDSPTKLLKEWSDFDRYLRFVKNPVIALTSIDSRGLETNTERIGEYEIAAWRIKAETNEGNYWFLKLRGIQRGESFWSKLNPFSKEI